jgi:hypothetical protein
MRVVGSWMVYAEFAKICALVIQMTWDFDAAVEGTGKMVCIIDASQCPA